LAVTLVYPQPSWSETNNNQRFSTALAKAGVNLSVIATYNTDYILVEEAKLTTAIEALRGAGFEVIE
jgi:hypothetical protein